MNSFRRTTRIACRNDSLSGSSSARSAASCMRPRMAKCAIIKPKNSCRTSSGVLLRNTILAPRTWQFIQRGFDLPALMIERRQFLGARHRGIENGCDQTIDRFGVGHALQPILDDADLHAIGLAPPVLVGGIDVAQIRTVRQALLARQPRIRLDPPEKVGAGGAGANPHLVAEEVSIRQA